MGYGHQASRHTRGMNGLICRTVFCAMALALQVPAAHAQIYECIDARGAREFANACSPGTVRQRQVGRGDEPAAAAPAGESKSPVQQEVEFRKRLQERQDAEAKANEARGKSEEAERNCIVARGQLKGLLEGQRMSRIDPDTGERVNYSDEERAAEAEEQRKSVEQWCK